MNSDNQLYIKLVFSLLPQAHVANDDLDMRKDADRHFILQIALKCADISNPCRSWSTCKNWSKRVCDEFFQQGKPVMITNIKISHTSNAPLIYYWPTLLLFYMTCSSITYSTAAC